MTPETSFALFGSRATEGSEDQRTLGPTQMAKLDVVIMLSSDLEEILLKMYNRCCSRIPFIRGNVDTKLWKKKPTQKFSVAHLYWKGVVKFRTCLAKSAVPRAALKGIAMGGAVGPVPKRPDFS